MACVYCYSGTGNSLFAARQIAEALDAELRPMTNTAETCDEDVIGFVFPVYYWGLPKTAERFVKMLKVTKKDPYVFVVTTYGGTAFGVMGVLAKLLKEKGVNVSYGSALKSVENYTPGYKVNNTPEMRKQYDRDLKAIKRDIALHARKGFARPTVLNTIISNLFFPAKHADCDKQFTVSDACAGCGNCRDICPAGNIRMEEGKPVFQHRCEHCISCIHACEFNALDWKSAVAKHGRYRHSGVTLEELIALSDHGQSEANQ